jgi:Domain of unknown function (DUF397)
MHLQREETEMQVPEEDLSCVARRKSRPSRADGSCVEVGVWAKSTYSDAANGCVEASAVISGHGLDVPAGAASTTGPGRLILLRDSKNPDGGTLAFGEHEWSAFIAGIKASEIDVTGRTVQRESID